ncbi:hypothetical protein C0993_012168 [Termitomyces sp. T159_Od127]|nr:hypothetical protein C0993_012168 [Termitomyces sp. T159_Od127]
MGFTLLIFALIGQSRGNTVWTASVEEANFFKSNNFPQPGAVPVYIPAAPNAPAPVQQQYPMVQQQMGPAPGHSGLPEV